MLATTLGLAHELWADARYALRQMRRRPAFSSIVMLALGLGIGGCVALVTVVYGLLVRPLPYADESHIHKFWMDYDWTGAEYDFLRQRLGVFKQLAAYSTTGATYTPNTHSTEGATVLTQVVSTPTLFAVLGVKPMLGRTYDANDDRPGAPPVVVVSYGLWQDDLGGDRNAIGRQILLDGDPVTVIGVMPKDFFFPSRELRAWRPLQIDPTKPLYKNGWLVFVARSAPGTPAVLVDREIKRLARELGARFTYPLAWDKTKNPSWEPIHQYLLGDVREPLLLLLGAVALLFLIACANAAALILARTSDRSEEMSVRTALGADAWRLARQIVMESMVLAACAAVVGSLIASAGFRVLVSRLPIQGSMGNAVTIGWATFATAFVCGLTIALVVSIAPIANIMRGVLGAVSRERSDAGLRRGARRVHSAIIAVQVMFAVLLVVGATLLIRTVERIRDHDPGFDARGVTTYNVFLGSGVEPATRNAFFQTLVARVKALPGVTAAGLVNRLPIRDLGYQTVMRVEGRPDLDGGRRPNALYRPVTPGFFGAMAMRIVAGRGIDSTDAASSMPVAVVSESFARAMWPGQNAIGKHVSDAWTGTRVTRTVVGVLRETRLTSMTKDGPFAFWLPLTQTTSPWAEVLVVRSTLAAAVLMPQVRRTVAAVSGSAAVARAQTMEDVESEALAAPLRLRFFFSVFGGLALLLGAIGVYGVVSYAVARRRGEFAVRMALGAAPGAVSRQVLGFGLAPVAVGVIVGSVAALGAMRFVAGFLYGVTATDIPSFAAAAITLLAAGLAAAIVPAVRAGRTSPSQALRAS